MSSKKRKSDTLTTSDGVGDDDNDKNKNTRVLINSEIKYLPTAVWLFNVSRYLTLSPFLKLARINTRMRTLFAVEARRFKWLFNVSRYLTLSPFLKLASGNTRMRTLFAEEARIRQKLLPTFKLVASSGMLSLDDAWQLRLLSKRIHDATRYAVDNEYHPNIFYCICCDFRSKIPNNADINHYTAFDDDLGAVMICHHPGRPGDTPDDQNESCWRNWKRNWRMDDDWRIDDDDDDDR